MSFNRNLFFKYFILFLFLIQAIHSQEIMCSICRAKIADSYNLVNVKSSVSLSSNFKNKFYKKKVLSHTFRNPHKILFEVVTVSEARLVCDHTVHEENSFFPGYGWKICMCPMCGNHHGWHFSPVKSHCQVEENDMETSMNRKPFYGLVTANLVSSHSEKLEL
jgi:hypothetical protein